MKNNNHSPLKIIGYFIILTFIGYCLSQFNPDKHHINDTIISLLLNSLYISFSLTWVTLFLAMLALIASSFFKPLIKINKKIDNKVINTSIYSIGVLAIWQIIDFIYKTTYEFLNVFNTIDDNFFISILSHFSFLNLPLTILGALAMWDFLSHKEQDDGNLLKN